ncbi:tissue factor pathway inhibitor-like [Alligator mississippiensis]|uniref:tissue factor pathway inhibitor-like n=1 Tax=Alligator mississippiensis TaxID=8496 RepID=UPI002877FBAE|nr:tissue factor pathway inhibitor-like [Alligator mississippiensis]
MEQSGDSSWAPRSNVLAPVEQDIGGPEMPQVSAGFPRRAATAWPTSTYSLQYYYDAATDSCKEFIYGGCGGNGNLWAGNLSWLDGDDLLFPGDLCRFLPDTGNCRTHASRYYYNWVTRTCQQFTYGVCQGNANNFKTRLECEKRCKVGGKGLSLPGPDAARGMEAPGRWPDVQGRVKLDICRLPPEQGMCARRLIRYYYNWVFRRCQQFIYGGCQGNANNFKTLLECENTCKVGGKGMSLPGPDAARGMAAPGRWPDVQGRVKLGRPGRCPQPKGVGSCLYWCKNDEQCPWGQKCCSNGCGRVCMGAV